MIDLVEVDVVRSVSVRGDEFKGGPEALLDLPIIRSEVFLWNEEHVLTDCAAITVLDSQELERAFRQTLPFWRASHNRPSRGRMALGVGTFAAALWTWHLPGPYDATLRSDLVYWIMHLTTFGAALLLWNALLDRGGCVGSALIAALVTVMQMSLLGALLTLAPKPLFAVHITTTWPWGFSPIEDQQLGGLVMWVPGCLLLTLYALVAFGRGLRRVGEQPDSLRRV